MRMRLSDRSRGCALRPLVACLAVALSLGANASARFADIEAIASTTSPDQPTSTYLVENCDDAAQGSLRDAVNAANLAGQDATIKFDLTAMGCSTISLKTGEIDVTIENLTIQGPDPDVVTIDGGYMHGYHNRIFKHTASIGVLHLDHVVLTEAKYVATGNQGAEGGCIYSSASVYLSNSRVDNCRVFTESGEAKGGGVSARGIGLANSVLTNCGVTSQLSTSLGGGIFVGQLGLQAKDSTVSDNDATSFAPIPNALGGGAELHGASTFERSTISGNIAGWGAGLDGVNAIALANSTVANNEASYGYGAVSVQDALSIYNSTIAFNLARSSTRVGGVRASSIYAVSSLLARNVRQYGGNEVESDATSGDGQIGGSHNLIMVAENGTTTPMDTRTDCPRLAPLLYNGGATATVGLLPASPAIDRGSDDFSLGTDQRGAGFARVIGANADIGAYEWSATSGDEINRNSFELCE